MTNNKFIIDAVKGEPNSLTAIAFHTGELLERERIIKLLEELDMGRCCFESHDLIAFIKGENK